jgi:hypothetical protein
VRKPILQWYGLEHGGRFEFEVSDLKPSRSNSGAADARYAATPVPRRCLGLLPGPNAVCPPARGPRNRGSGSAPGRQARYPDPATRSFAAAPGDPEYFRGRQPVSIQLFGQAHACMPLSPLCACRYAVSQGGLYRADTGSFTRFTGLRKEKMQRHQYFSTHMPIVLLVLDTTRVWA